VGHPTEPDFLFSRHLEPFVEGWEIIDGKDGYDSEYDKCIFSSDTWMYVMNGKVETVTRTLAYLAGGKMHASGVAWVEFVPSPDPPYEPVPVFFGEGINTFSSYAGSD